MTATAGTFVLATQPAAAPATGEAVAFWICAVVAVFAAVGMIFSRSAVHGALLLAVDMLCLAVLYAVLEAPFLAFVQVIVYTGAVMMLFLFVLMLVGVDASDSLIETIRGQRVWAALAALGFGVLLVGGVGTAVTGQTSGLAQANSEGNVQGLASLMFTKYVFAFEATAALLITAGMGAMVLAHRERIRPRTTQQERATQRFRGPRPSPLPNPGVYARHNAVDMPGLLPDGSTAPESMSSVITTQREDRDQSTGARRPAGPEGVAVPPAEREGIDLPSEPGREDSE